MRILCFENVCQSFKHHFETKHKTFRDEADKVESIKRAVCRHLNQANALKVFSDNHPPSTRLIIFTGEPSKFIVAMHLAYMDGIQLRICWRFSFSCGVLIKLDVNVDMAH